jgi:hypothetical protein
MRLIERLKLRLVSPSLSLNIIGLSISVSTLHNAMLAYMSMFHFEEALKCVDFILDNYC